MPAGCKAMETVPSPNGASLFRWWMNARESASHWSDQWRLELNRADWRDPKGGLADPHPATPEPQLLGRPRTSGGLAEHLSHCGTLLRSCCPIPPRPWIPLPGVSQVG